MPVYKLIPTEKKHVERRRESMLAGIELPNTKEFVYTDAEMATHPEAKSPDHLRKDKLRADTMAIRQKEVEDKIAQQEQCLQICGVTFELGKSKNVDEAVDAAGNLRSFSKDELAKFANHPRLEVVGKAKEEKAAKGK